MINQVVAGVRETFADGGLDQAVLIRSLSLVEGGDKVSTSKF